MSKILLILRWLLTRVAVLILIWCLILPQLVNFKTINDRLKVRRLNDNRPNFSSLVAFSQGRGDVSPQEWRHYQDYFRLVLKYIPDDPVAEGFLGFMYLQTKNEAQAIALLEKSAFKAPLFFWSDYNLGVYYYRQGNFKLAAQHLQNAVNVPVTSLVSVMMSSIIYRQIFVSSNFKSSVAKQVQQAYQDAYVLLLASLDALGMSEASVSLSLRALKDKFNQQDSLYYYSGLGFFKMRQYDKALFFFNKSMEMANKEPWSYFWIAKLFEINGDQEKAAEYIKAFTLLKGAQQLLPYDQRMSFRVF